MTLINIPLPALISQQSTEIVEGIATSLSDSEVCVRFFTGLIIPIVLLIFFGLIKYGVGTRRQDIQWFHLATEIPIDLLSIFSSLLICQHFTSQSSTLLIIVACTLILISLVLAYSGSIFRCWFNEQLKIKTPTIKTYLWLGIDYIFVIVWLFVILKFPTWIPL